LSGLEIQASPESLACKGSATRTVTKMVSAPSSSGPEPAWSKATILSAFHYPVPPGRVVAEKELVRARRTGTGQALGLEGPRCLVDFGKRHGKAPQTHQEDQECYWTAM